MTRNSGRPLNPKRPEPGANKKLKNVQAAIAREEAKPNPDPEKLRELRDAQEILHRQAGIGD